MKFLLDESADFPLAAQLEDQGHDVSTIVRDHPRALQDRQVIAIAHREGRILITNDRDFGELVFRRRLPHAGVILFRLADETLETKLQWLAHLLTNYVDSLHHFIVVTERGVRVRRGR